ncbi:MAG: ribonuclease E/G [Alphaproteobacteria bacterium]
MTRRLVIAHHDDLLCAAIQNKNIVTDFYAGKSAAPDLTGAIVRAKVTRLLPGQKAAIVTWGKEQEGYWADARPNTHTGDWATLQIKSDARQGKQPQLTGDVALSGRFLVHLPFGKKVSQSRRGGAAVAFPKDLPGGWIIRRHAAEASAELIRHEAEYLLRLAEPVKAAADRPEVLLMQPSWQRAVVDHGVALAEIVCHDAALEKTLRAWLKDFAPDLAETVRHGDSGLDLDGLLQGITASAVALPNGARLIMEPASAFWAVDVDAGGGAKSCAGEYPGSARVCAADAAAQYRRHHRRGFHLAADAAGAAEITDMPARRGCRRSCRSRNLRHQQAGTDRNDPQAARIEHHGFD